MNQIYTPYITKHFSYAEVTTTSTGIPNIPGEEDLAAIRVTANKMEQVRQLLMAPIKINSWFRSERVNTAVGGSKTSEHRLGYAVDFTCPAFGTPLAICELLMDYAETLNYNQLIFEQTWVHISFPPPGTRGKRQNLEYRNGRYTPLERG